METDCISQELSVSLHLESVGHELDQTVVGISTDRHQEPHSNVQARQQIAHVQQLLTILLLNCNVVHQRILAEPNNMQIF